MSMGKRENKKTATTETQNKTEAQKLSPPTRGSNNLNTSVVARKVSKPKKASELTMELYDVRGKVVDAIDLPKEIFGAKVNDQLMAQAIRVYLANQRMGTASTKTRGEVRGSTKKIWAQKHTGRARHGSRKAPIFVGGGIVSGPKQRDFSLRVSKKMRRLALFSSLTSKLKKGEIRGITGFGKIEPKTKLMVNAMKNLGINEKDIKVLLVVPSHKKEFENLYRAARNIKGVNVQGVNLLNAYEVLDNKMILLMKESLKSMEDRFLKTKDG